MFRYENQNNYFQRARKIQLEILKIKYEFIDIEDLGINFILILMKIVGRNICV